jgi:hypothetical protein
MYMITSSCLALCFLFSLYIYGIIAVLTIYYDTSVCILRSSSLRCLLYTHYSNCELIILAYPNFLANFALLYAFVDRLKAKKRASAVYCVNECTSSTY